MSDRRDSEIARLRSALRVAIAHLSEDMRQANLPAKEKAEDKALVDRLRRALGREDAA